MISKDLVLDYLKQYKKKHTKDYNLNKIGLFGSIARGDNNKHSDLDIVVEFSKPNLFVQAGIMEDLKEKFNVDVDVIALSNHMNPKLLNRINKDVIYV
ncbi:MAG: nucleotidyltransferase [Arcobacter sp.]|nr:nucleotidyltransferase [Arcobacter sp.]|tara:strand:- start:13315 stop:13608 length:294 start_codon:yes stop_codon:yes gene_type:complete